MRGILNIIVGLVFLFGGLSGQIVIKGTQSSGGAAVLGGILVLVGVLRLAFSGKSQS